MLHAAILPGTDQQINPNPPLSDQQVVNIGFRISNHDKLGGRTGVARRIDGRQTAHPTIAFFVRERTGMVVRQVAKGCRIACPDMLMQNPQGHRFRRECQRGRQQQPYMFFV